MNSRVCSGEVACPSRMQATPDIICPLVQFAAPRQSLNCYDRVAFEAHGERQAGVDPLAVDVDRAGPALAEVAALLRPGEAQVLAQGVKKRGARVERQRVLLTVYGERNGHHDRPPKRRACWEQGRPYKTGRRSR